MKTKSFFIAPAIIALFAFSSVAQNHPRATASSVETQTRNHANGPQVKALKFTPTPKPTSEYYGMPKFNLCPYRNGSNDGGPVGAPGNNGNTRR